MSKEFEKGTLRFRPRARLLYLLGHDLISDEAIAMTELVKNGYDADTEQVTVTLTNVTTKANGTIEIRDKGHGMTLGTIKKAWMEPARDNKKKRANGERIRTKRFHRLPLGEKGIGRFSADKLGLRLEIVSRFCEFDPKTKKAINLSPEEIVVVVEGKKFLEDAYLDEIECNWLSRVPTDFAGEAHGTLLRISDLRVDWSREMVENVRNSLARLSSPFDEAKDFDICFSSNDFPDLSSKIENPLLSIAPFWLDARIDESGLMKYEIKGPDKKPENGEEDLRKGNDKFLISNQEGVSYRKPSCGPFRFRLYAFERDRTKVKKFGMDKPKLELLNLLCGVSIYRDNFRVAPYGEHGNDWLNFDRRRVLNPGKILGNDRVIGFVEISQSLNPHLRDKTNREGLIEEGTAFADLRELTMVAADFLGLYRYNSEPHEKRRLVKIEEGKNALASGKQFLEESYLRVATALANARRCVIENNSEEAAKAINLAEMEVQKNREAIKQMEEGGRTLLEEIQLSSEQIKDLVSLAGIGMTAERMTHEFSQALKHARESLQASLGILNLDRNHNPEINKNITLAVTQLEIAKDQVKQMEPLYYSKRRETEPLNVAEIAHNMEILYSNTIKELGLKLEFIGDSDLEVDMGRGHLMQVFDNLFDNTFFWLRHTPSSDQPRICIRVSSKDRTVIFADNGPGISEHIKHHLFEPFVSTKPNGRGLGLFIISDILQNYKAEIDIMTEGLILKGANFRIRFPGD